MRETVRGLLLAYPAFMSELKGDELRVVSSSAVTLELQREPPFVVIRMGSVMRMGPGPANTRTMTIWCHDHPGDYGRIDRMLWEARQALDVWGIRKSRGSLMRSQWMSEGEDNYDDGFKTIVRTGTWDITGTGD